jgi:hypothetical protein
MASADALGPFVIEPNLDITCVENVDLTPVVINTTNTTNTTNFDDVNATAFSDGNDTAADVFDVATVRRFLQEDEEEAPSSKAVAVTYNVRFEVDSRSIVFNASSFTQASLTESVINGNFSRFLNKYATINEAAVLVNLTVDPDLVEIIGYLPVETTFAPTESPFDYTIIIITASATMGVLCLIFIASTVAISYKKRREKQSKVHVGTSQDVSPVKDLNGLWLEESISKKPGKPVVDPFAHLVTFQIAHADGTVDFVESQPHIGERAVLHDQRISPRKTHEDVDARDEGDDEYNHAMAHYEKHKHASRVSNVGGSEMPRKSPRRSSFTGSLEDTWDEDEFQEDLLEHRNALKIVPEAFKGEPEHLVRNYTAPNPNAKLVFHHDLTPDAHLRDFDADADIDSGSGKQAAFAPDAVSREHTGNPVDSAATQGNTSAKKFVAPRSLQKAQEKRGSRAPSRTHTDADDDSSSDDELVVLADDGWLRASDRLSRSAGSDGKALFSTVGKTEQSFGRQRVLMPAHELHTSPRRSGTAQRKQTDSFDLDGYEREAEDDFMHTPRQILNQLQPRGSSHDDIQPSVLNRQESSRRPQTQSRVRDFIAQYTSRPQTTTEQPQEGGGRTNLFIDDDDQYDHTAMYDSPSNARDGRGRAWDSSSPTSSIGMDAQDGDRFDRQAHRASPHRGLLNAHGHDEMEEITEHAVSIHSQNNRWLRAQEEDAAGPRGYHEGRGTTNDRPTMGSDAGSPSPRSTRSVSPFDREFVINMESEDSDG